MFGKQNKMALCLTAMAGMLIVPAWLTADVCLAAAETETVIEIRPLQQPFVFVTDCGVFRLTGTVRAVFHMTVTDNRVVVQCSVGANDVLVLDDAGNDEYIVTGVNNQNFQFELGVGHRQHVASSIHIIGRGNLPNLIGQITGTAEFDADGNLIDLVVQVNRLDCVS